MVNKALVIAHGVHESGRREILSIDVGEAETEAFWTEFLRGLVGRGLVGVQLAISDAHAGLKAAIATVLGCCWQRCTVHYADSRVMPTRVRASCSRRDRLRFGRHHHSASRNASTRSVGR